MSAIKNILKSQVGSQPTSESRSDELFETKIDHEIMVNDNERASEMWMEIIVWIILIGLVFVSM